MIDSHVREARLADAHETPIEDLSHKASAYLQNGETLCVCDGRQGERTLQCDENSRLTKAGMLRNGGFAGSERPAFRIATFHSDSARFDQRRARISLHVLLKLYRSAARKYPAICAGSERELISNGGTGKRETHV